MLLLFLCLWIMDERSPSFFKSWCFPKMAKLFPMLANSTFSFLKLFLMFTSAVHIAFWGLQWRALKSTFDRCTTFMLTLTTLLQPRWTLIKAMVFWCSSSCFMRREALSRSYHWLKCYAWSGSPFKDCNHRLLNIKLKSTVMTSVVSRTNYTCSSRCGL